PAGDGGAEELDLSQAGRRRRVVNNGPDADVRAEGGGRGIRFSPDGSSSAPSCAHACFNGHLHHPFRSAPGIARLRYDGPKTGAHRSLSLLDALLGSRPIGVTRLKVFLMLIPVVLAASTLLAVPAALISSAAADE